MLNIAHQPHITTYLGTQDDCPNPDRPRTPGKVLYCIELYCIVLYCNNYIVLHCIVLYCYVLYCMYCIVCIVSYCIIMYCMYCIVCIVCIVGMYCIVLYLRPGAEDSWVHHMAGECDITRGALHWVVEIQQTLLRDTPEPQLHQGIIQLLHGGLFLEA